LRALRRPESSSRFCQVSADCSLTMERKSLADTSLVFGCEAYRRKLVDNCGVEWSALTVCFSPSFISGSSDLFLRLWGDDMERQCGDAPFNHMATPSMRFGVLRGMCRHLRGSGMPHTAFANAKTRLLWSTSCFSCHHRGVAMKALIDVRVRREV